MEETPNVVLSGLSPEARRNLVETATLTPRDKENAGANSTSTSQSETVDQSKGPSSSTAAASPPPVPPVRTPARLRSTNQASHRNQSPTFFSAATTPSPAASASATLTPTCKDSTSTSKYQQQIAACTTTPNPLSVPSLNVQKSPPGTSQVLRKHFQSLGFATPQGKHPQQQQRLISSGAVRLTPNSRKKGSKGNHHSMACRRIGYDGTRYTPSQELLKSTTSSRNQRVLGLQDMSAEQQQLHPQSLQLEQQPGDMQIQQQLHPRSQLQQLAALETMMMDDETSTVASAATLDDASFDMSLPSMNQPSFVGNSSNVIPAPHSPLTPRMGCLNPVAFTLLNDGKEDYHYLLTQDSLYPIPKVEDTTDPGTAATPLPLPNNNSHASSSSSSSSSSASSCCVSPTQCFGGSAQSPAEVRGTLSHKVRSTLARPVAIMAKTGRISPSTLSQPHKPRLAMRPQPNHVR